MAYADQSMSGNKVTAIVIVALIHVFIGYALVTGLAYEAYKKAVEKVTTVDIKEEEPKKEEPPPPPEKKVEAPPPPVAPPVKINVATTPPQIQTVTTAPPPAPPVVLAAPAPIVAPPAPPAPTGPTSGAQPKGSPASWATNDDYPQAAIRKEAQGTTGFSLTVGPDGRVTGCTVTSSSGSPELDDATCKLVTRRARFKPAVQNGTPVAGSFASRIRWVLPE
ncbi:energy transducer TonB [uncultured Novosphingobium sp.]|uniref:energy transducer TonB n=1 Tax=Novosphingobium fluoreni TaxID=1391222 RepID=UPI000735E8D8|nr:energy transducer TonB [uncultured Novosphingobium sp.]KTR82731.1 energy transducer TonB [Novosphingobium barchaimii]